MKKKLEVGCFWCDMTNKKDPPIYWMNVVSVDDYGRFEPVTSVELSLEVFQLFHNDGKALRSCLTKISKINDIKPITNYQNIK